LEERFGYYSSTIDIAPTEEQLELTAEQVASELQRIHKEAMDYLKDRNPNMDSPAPLWHSSYGDLLTYLAFHNAYHTGQMYSVRHLLGDDTPDN
jgi:uncharacterized damage-inducible protein DinB